MKYIDTKRRFLMQISVRGMVDSGDFLVAFMGNNLS